MEPPILRLNAELLALMLRLVTAEADAKYLERYGVRAPPSLQRVCRRFREALPRRRRARVLCVPLLRPLTEDKWVPTFSTVPEWAAYFRKVGGVAADIRLVAYGGPLDVAAHLASAGMTPSVDEHSTLPWMLPTALNLCVQGMGRPLAARVTFLELCLPMPSDNAPPLRVPHVETVRPFLAMTGLRQVSARVVVFRPSAPTEEEEDLACCQNMFFGRLWNPLATAIRQSATARPLEELRIAYDGGVPRGMDDFVLKFVCMAASAGVNTGVFQARTSAQATWWSVSYLGTARHYRTFIKRVRLMDHGTWPDDPVIIADMLSLLSLERLEFAGAHAFQPRFSADGPVHRDLERASADRLTPLTLALPRDVSFVSERPAWLRVVSLD